MEGKDLVLAAGVVVTLVLGVWNAITNHRINVSVASRPH